MYKGKTVEVPMGAGGIRVDDNQDRIPPTSLIEAENINIKFGYVEKDFGSRRWTQSSLGSPIRALIDFWPDVANQRVIAVCADGNIYKLPDGYSAVALTAGTGAQAVLTPPFQTHLLLAGNEIAGRNRKVFVFTGHDPVQVISGDATTRTNITNPPTEWSGSNQPSFGILHRGRVFAFGNLNNPHQVYASNPADHEDFQTSALSWNVFPGDGERLVSAHVYKGRLFFFKYPFGVYYLDDSDTDSANWFIVKYTDSFGIASPHSAASILDDFFVANASGSMTSLKATNAFGGVEMGDVFNILKCLKYIQQNLTLEGFFDRNILYYEQKKLAYITYKGKSSVNIDRMVIMDFTNPQNPQITLNTRDQASCMALKKDQLQVLRPIYGAEDGHIYEMGTEGVFVDRNVNGSAYRGAFQTPHLDFGFADASIADTNKLFDHLEITFLPAGNWNVSVDVYIDNVYSETLSFKQSTGRELGNFTLDTDRISPVGNRAYMRPLHGMGRRISFYVYNSGAGQYFKISAMRVYFRLAAQQQKGA